MTKIDFRHRLPQDMKAMIEGSRCLKEKWEELTPLARNEWICWVTIVKKAETRKEHLDRFKEEVLADQKRPCCWPGCPHRRPIAKKYFT